MLLWAREEIDNNCMLVVAPDTERPWLRQEVTRASGGVVDDRSESVVLSGGRDKNSVSITWSSGGQIVNRESCDQSHADHQVA